MTTRTFRRSALIGLFALGAAACGPAGTPSGQINVNNASTIAITIAVNNSVFATVPAGAMETPIPGVLPARPWLVEARSPSGRVLASLTVGPGDDISQQSSRGDVEFLACGEVALWAGGPMPDVPRPSASPKPCD